ncbi:efflux RND transporter periplasmic adaptor subunit [Methylovirgula sp. 4M-Z18]|uniref:efflux RND transporter periplasmic adaptor subunit n=1 Tax=Methylovirgula sp. 4M-Z18 TaxID=2293567 RepID=UPI000E2E964D|nr:efflux RND transporter periplasmic adaptor subunit [Methylovirgula sp. 4M-Z18]RFB78342.1 efflux RND transporter periplasmic adaptor subunit [Methylovirgula sp. 4M-Z18]
MIKRMIFMLVLVGVVFFGLNWFVNWRANFMKETFAKFANPTQIVAATVAKSDDWQPKITAIGTFRAVKGADLSLQQAGIVDQIKFQSGDDVKAGDDLLELRKEDDLARLASLKATAELAAVNLRRDQEQLKIKAVSQATVDTDIANQKSADAAVTQQQALIDQKTLVAPFAGRLGIRQVDLGQYIGAGTAIVTLQDLESVFLDFVLPQQAVDTVKVGQKVTAHVDAFPNVNFDGEIAAINPRVDQASRNVQIRALFKNPDHKLLPGMYATVNISIGNVEHYVTLPQTAVVYNSYGNLVYVTEQKEGTSDITAKQVFVKTGATRGDQVAILSGIEEGTSVVTGGQMKLRNGSLVKIDNSNVPPAEANPKPVDQ